MAMNDRAASLISARTRSNRWTTGAKALASCAAVLCLALLPLDARAASKSDVDHKKWWAWAEVGGFYDSEYDGEVEVEVFLPIAQSAYSLLFLDIEGELFEHDMQDGAVALGYRQMFSNGWNFGVWAGPEVRRTDSSNRFWRFTAGLEMLHPDYDARFNAYTPFSHTQASGGPSAGLVSTSQVILDFDEIYMLHILSGAEVPLWGFDGEVGVRVPLEMAGLDPNNAELRLYGGGFYFDASEALEEIAGPKARAELRFYDVIPGLTGSRLTAEYEYSYDDVRGDRHKAGARFRIPFDTTSTSVASLTSSGHALTRQERRMLDGIERADIFVSRAPGETLREQVGDALTGVIFDRVAYVDSADDLSDVSHTAGPNTLIIVNGTIVTSETEDIQGVQTIQGGSSTIPVFGVDSGTVVDFTAPGARPTLTTAEESRRHPGIFIRMLGDHTHLAGFDIDGNGTNWTAIVGGSNKSADPLDPGLWNIVIDNINIHNITRNGIKFDSNNSHVLIFNNTNITGSTDVDDESISNGIWFGFDNDNVQISDVHISDFIGGLDAGILMTRNNTATISNTAIENVSGDGIQAISGNQVDISNVHISGTGWSGIGIWYDNDVTISNNTRITDAARVHPFAAGIFIIGDLGGNNVTITDTTIAGSTRDGIVARENNVVTIANTTITDSDEHGISVGDAVFDVIDSGGFNTITISNSTIDGAGEDGLHFQKNTDVNTVTMNNTTFTGDFGDDVIGIDIAGNTLSGAGNVSNPSSVGDQFCDVSGAQTGSFGFSVPVTTCP